MSADEATPSDVLSKIGSRDISSVNKGLDEQERSDGLYEMHWWDFNPGEFEESLEHLKEYANVSVQITPDGYVRVTVSQCIRPVPAEEHDAHMREHTDNHERYSKGFDQD